MKCGQQIIGNISSLLLLIYASGLSLPIEKINDKIIDSLSIVIKPTLSPKDLNFPAWWEQHKS